MRKAEYRVVLERGSGSQTRHAIGADKVEGVARWIVSGIYFIAQLFADLYTHNSHIRNNQSRKSNMFDNMMALMEKYAYNLESLVQERTTQLSEEKKKTENLLLRMLPR